MVLIDGAIATQSLVSYLVEQYTNQQEHNIGNQCDACLDCLNLPSPPPFKRIRAGVAKDSDPRRTDLAFVVMPVALNDTFAETLRECIPSNFYATDGLIASWTAEQVRVWSDTFINARLVIQNSDDLTLIQNEALQPQSLGNDANRLYSALARAASLKVVECPRICIHYYHRPTDTQYTPVVELRMTVAINGHQSAHRTHLFNLINELYPSTHEAPEDVSVEAFFRHLQPPVSKQHVMQCQSQLLVPKLAPFQSQNVEWMLLREGHVFVDEAGTVGPLRDNNDGKLPLFWEAIRFKSNTPIYINRISQQYTLVRNPALDEMIALSYRGGILADEMGLGKTVCVIALLLLHKRTAHDPLHPKPDQADGLLTTSATLIITPSAILQQWESELSLHAPSLRVITYRGIKQAKGETVETAESLSKYDVVLTDYKVLQEEFHHATPHPDRPRRHAARYVHQRSPLVELLWFRVILDEAQMVESRSVNHVVQMAMMIPHWYAWGVTGTPIKCSFDDLFGLCRFLSLAPCIQKPSQFKTLLSTSPIFRGLFWDFAKQIMRRNIKAMLTDQIHIPTQHRRIVKVAFSPIEQHYYQTLWGQCARATNFEMLDRRGWVVAEESETDDMENPQAIYAKLRTWLLTLRQACVHPTIGNTNKLRIMNQAVRTLDEVLYALINQSNDEIETLGHLIATSRIRRGGMHELLKHWETARDVYVNEAIPYIVDLLEAVEERIKQVKKKAEEEDEEEKLHQHQDGDHGVEAEDISMVARTKRAEDGRYQAIYHRKLRLQMCLHQCYFFLAGVFHEMGEEVQESENYNKAAGVRREILGRAEERVNVAKKDIEKPLTLMDTTIPPSPQKETLYLNFDLLDRINTIAQILNEQLVYINQCRSSLQELLCASLVDHNEDDDEVTGHEYEQSLLLQEKIDLYQSVYQALLSDRAFLLNGIWVAGLRHDIDEQQKDADTLEGSENPPPPEEEIKCLKIKLWAARKKFSPRSKDSDYLRSITFRLREISANPSISHIEKGIISREIYRLNTELSKQCDMQERLETEYRRFTIIYNHRIEYYRSLQQISDEVVDWESKNPEGEIKTLLATEEQQQKAVKEKSARRRYLENISKEKSQDDEKSRRCLVCLSDFTKGIMTFCGHMYCKTCATLWFRSHRRCPQCNTSVSLEECYAIAWDKSVEEIPKSKPIPANQEQLISPSLLRKINEQEIEGGLGAKLDSIIRHIKYIIYHTGGKSVVFSQWKDVLDLIAGGLKKNNITSIQLDGVVRDDRIRRFRDDPNTHVILLHARSQSSGLTLVSAQTVFIVEPVLNEALERQAINRVHRIGQTKETTVYWYIVQDTIEERIHAIHSAQRQRRTRSEEEEPDEVYPIPEAPTALVSRSEGGGERVSDADLQRCFTSDESWALGLGQTPTDAL